MGGAHVAKNSDARYQNLQNYRDTKKPMFSADNKRSRCSFFVSRKLSANNFRVPKNKLMTMNRWSLLFSRSYVPDTRAQEICTGTCASFLRLILMQFLAFFCSKLRGITCLLFYRPTRHLFKIKKNLRKKAFQTCKFLMQVDVHRFLVYKFFGGVAGVLWGAVMSELCYYLCVLLHT